MEGIQKAKDFLANLQDVKKDLPCVILVNGKQVKLPSGKTAWKNKGAARSALSNALSSHTDINWRYVPLIRKVLEDEGYVEIKEFRL